MRWNGWCCYTLSFDKYVCLIRLFVSFVLWVAGNVSNSTRHIFLRRCILYTMFQNASVIIDRPAQQTLSMGPINISLRTLKISCDYLRCRVITIRLHWINPDIKQIWPLKFVIHRIKIGHVKIHRELRKSWMVYWKS